MFTDLETLIKLNETFNYCKLMLNEIQNEDLEIDLGVEKWKQKQIKKQEKLTMQQKVELLEYEVANL